MRRVFREMLTTGDAFEAFCDVRAWGYPRDVLPIELDTGLWFRYGGDVVFWFQSDPSFDEKTYAVHLCVAPSARRSIYPRRFLVGIEVLAESLGAEQLVAYDLGDEMKDFVERRRWSRDPSRDKTWICRLKGDE